MESDSTLGYQEIGRPGFIESLKDWLLTYKPFEGKGIVTILFIFIIIYFFEYSEVFIIIIVSILNGGPNLKGRRLNHCMHYLTIQLINNGFNSFYNIEAVTKTTLE